jgi:hypothetical protein
MKILKEPKQPEWHKDAHYQGKCDSCGAVIVVDGRFKEADGVKWSWVYKNYRVHCPRFSCFNDITLHRVKKSWWRQLLRIK